jgi:LPP20 lipoprotein
MRTLLLVTLGVSLFCGGCAHRQSKPDWITGEAAAYPASRFLLGRGEGASQQQAIDRARAELAKIFRVAITDETIDTQTVTTTRKGGRKAHDQQSEATRTVTTWTDELLEGIEVARVWQDPQTRSYYALAVLGRAQTAQSLRRRMQQLDLQTDQDLKRARSDSDTDRLQQISALDRALEAQRQRQSLQQYLSIVESTASTAPPTWNYAELRSEYTAALRGVHIDTLARNDPTGKLQAVLAGAVAGAGFSLGGQQTDYVALVGLQMHELVERDGWYWLRGTLELQLTEAGGRVRGVKRWNIKVSAQQPELAQQRALDEVSAILQKELRTTIVGFAGGA